MDKIKKWWGGLSSNQKFFVGLVGLLILWLVYRSFKGAILGLGQTIQGQSEISTLAIQGIKPSYSSATYVKFADQLYKAMNGAGTDEETIFKVFNYCHNDADISKLQSAFGVRDAGGLTDAAGLNEWIKDDLDSNSIATINSLLTQKGITKLIK